jgi:hypothetical protein
MNPVTNQFEMLTEETDEQRVSRENASLFAALFPAQQQDIHEAWKSVMGKVEPVLLRPNGEPWPDHWPKFCAGESVTIKGYVFQIAHIGNNYMTLEPIGPAKKR